MSIIEAIERSISLRESLVKELQDAIDDTNRCIEESRNVLEYGW